MTLELRKQGVVDASPAPLRERARQQLIARRIAAVAVTRRQAWSAWQVLRQLPMTAVLLVGYAPRGVGRATTAWARYLRDHDSAELRQHHAGARETGDYARASQIRSANLTARLMVNGTIALAVLAVVLAWLAPKALGVLLAGLVFVWTLKVIPGRGRNEILGAAALAFLAYLLAPTLASYVPVPPAWAWWTVGLLAVGVFGWVGRPKARVFVTLPGTEMAGRTPALRAPMVTAALCTLGHGKMKTPDEIRLLMDVARHGQGYQIDLELPPGVPAAFAIGKREAFASALRRELGCVFLSVGRRHPGHLVVFVSDEPMAMQEQAPWPLMRGRKVDIFDALPMATDQRGDWVPITFAYASMVIGAVPRMGKTFLLRQALLACALDPRVHIYALDGKGTGDLGSLVPIAHFYSRGRKPDEIERVREMLRELRQELQDRSDFLDSLSEDECPENKVTSALASKYPAQLSPKVIGVDETQMYFDFGEKRNKEHAAIREELSAGFTELVKLGPAMGIIVALATQNVNTVTIPRGISTNVVIRGCLKVGDQIANDQVLGTSAYSKGLDATQFDLEDKGILYLAADGGRPQIVRSVAGLDVPACKRLAGLAREMRAAAGLLTGAATDEVDAVVVLDIVADVQKVLSLRSRPVAHLEELVEWLRELRPDYAALDVGELGKRLRNEGIDTGQVWANGRNRKGIDLRKRGR